MSLFDRIKEYDLQEKKEKKFYSRKGDGSSVKTETNPNETIFNDKPNKNKKYAPPKNPPKSYTRKNPTDRTLRRGFENVTGEGEVKYPKSRTDLITKRKYYEIDKKGNISKRGIEKYAREMYRNNLPLSKKQLDTAKQFAVGGKKIKDSTGKVVGTTTGKYGGVLKPKRKVTQKTLDSIKNLGKENPTTRQLMPAGSGKPIPLKKVKTIVKPKVTTFPSSPSHLKSPLPKSNQIYTPPAKELQKLTKSGFKKTTTGSFTKSGKTFGKLLTKSLKKMGTKGKLAAAVIGIGAAGYGMTRIGKNNNKNNNTMVPPIGFKPKEPKQYKFGISLGPGQTQK